MRDKVQVCRCGKTFVMRPYAVSGKLNTITTYEVEGGNIAVLPDGRYRMIAKDEDYNGPRFLSHFADCPKASSFKRPT